MARPGTTNPDLVSELRAMQRRVEALERKPIPQTFYDQYPSIEWAAIGRGRVSDNAWTSCGVANVTGLKYDRVECKFITNSILRGRSEAEVRLAAFRHDYTNQYKECISASSTIRLRGHADGKNYLGTGKWRWIHGIGFGWDYTDENNAIYTIELQHRYPDGQTMQANAVRQVFAYQKMSTDSDAWTKDLIQDGNNAWAPALHPASNGAVPNYGWVDVQTKNDVWDGSYAISNMHYCVGMDQTRLPDASENGWFWYTGAGTDGAQRVRDPDITELYYRQ
ncbi:hypothetical protein CPT_Shaeky_016 [Streptomyces phage Shaeky]|uniref:Minor tail protein n=1 Tax=Streptomyces phage Shaeky TaxID=2767586 RepID=A0A873WH92_9CAUD|nr:hypothetical protein CPT_Shaeky_016 [Streptomyces phage Shaeky]